METRKHGIVLKNSRATLSSEIPVDYRKMVEETLRNHFDDTLALLEKQHRVKFSWHVEGRIFSDEVVLAASLLPNSGIAATTGYTSVDFDPKASHPTAEESLSFCVDAMGAIFDSLLAEDQVKNRAALVAESLGAFENIPYEWAELEIEKKRVFVRFDRANPKLDTLATDWLAQNDPLSREEDDEFEEESSEMFFRGPKGEREEEEE